MSKKSFVDDAPTLFIQSGPDKSQLFAMNTARDLRHFVIRGTGGCGLMSEEDAQGLRNLEYALTGRSEHGRRRKALLQFSGLALFGGTRMVRRDNPRIIIPGITEVFPPIEKYCKRSAALGVIAKVGTLRHSKHGIVIADDGKAEYVTIVHPTQSSCVLQQPSADENADWEAEFKECANFIGQLINAKWQSLLVVYNGGGITEKEILTWCANAKTNPAWRVLLVNGSGRKADEYANNDKFLADNPTVHVCENDLDSMREKLSELGALVEPEES